MRDYFALLPQKTRSRQAFTLIELLMVIAILVILASILIPAVSQVKTKASSAQCATQIRTIGMALQMYLQDNDNILPSGAPFQNNPFSGQGPYYNRDPRRFQTMFGSYWDVPRAQNWSTTASKMDYDGTLAWPAWESGRRKDGAPSMIGLLPVELTTSTTRKAPTWGKSYTQIADPSNAPMLTEVDDLIAPGAWGDALPTEPVHGNYRNTLFFDGHVEQIDSSINLRKP
ncbi:prepilin-type N-terminal cleavage/methylation domain-containing protein [Coraliomargarita parva]|uniref:prepilin-type N-terminal cleavage/methylation domain-containing protein n=1 Tax=Coraliomargarita parva TaxID=3014050 RepID=UPI0022B3E61B|nr:prepilin-type N-terminal cleavage/methylation domain-containing protein [Coraliomargarita parva]